MRRKIYGDKGYIRGLIEFTNYCKNNCYYCGIRRGNSESIRYRLSRREILRCCDEGYRLGFRTYVLQGGEDMFYSDEYICGIISEITEKYSDCAVTLSIGEKSRKSYEEYFKAGANVVMPNLSPVRVRKLYELYDNKICTGEEAAQCRGCLENRVKNAGYRIVADIGNAKTKEIGENKSDNS